MNKTMIALIAVSLGAMLPVPAAQGLNTGCASTDVENVEEILAQVGNVNLPDPDQNGFDVCVVACPTGNGVDAGGAEVCLGDVGVPKVPKIPDDPTIPVDTCEDGEVGVRFQRGSSYTGRCQGLPGGLDGGHHPCKVTGYKKDDTGIGGTHATCYYACKKLDMLGIEVRADDTDADVSGYTDCGDANADCPRTAVTCHGAGGPANSNQADQGCVGRSYEVNSSPITVTCIAAGAGAVCQLTGLTCPGLQSSSANSWCKQQNPALDDWVDRLTTNLPDTPITSFVSFQFQTTETGVEGFVVQFDGSGAEPVCWVGPL
ncbi:MAG: hypothetical protein QOC71_1714 [Thermoplasmata archaeon]|jgi:hypothetical protein|nr:hypothetical protein [Thermoplasmata archaeon]